MSDINKIMNIDCLEGMKLMKDNSVDLVITSPPYAERRKSTYGGTPSDKYVQWFIPFAKEIKRILKPTGSFFLNIKPHTHKGERDLYVFELVISLKREVGFMFVDELCWTKNAFPGGYKGRLKNGFEPFYHFTKQSPSGIIFNPSACGTPMKPESIARTYRKQCGSPKNVSGMTGMNTTNIRHLKVARPSNVINVHNISNQFTEKSKHPATFPVKLIEFFIKTYSNDGSMVVDPFAGSGTTGVACRLNSRNFIGMEIDKEYCKIARSQINDCQRTLR